MIASTSASTVWYWARVSTRSRGGAFARLDLGESGQPFLGQPGQKGDRARAGGEGLERGAACDDWADRHRRLPWMGPILDPLGVPPRT